VAFPGQHIKEGGLKPALFRDKWMWGGNPARKCAFPRQKRGLEALSEKTHAKGLELLGFPGNQFGEREPGTAEEIAQFCSTTYGVTFPLTDKLEVNGASRHPLFVELTAAADAAGHDGDVRWNFEKWIVSRDGAVVARFSPQTQPDDPAVIAAIEAALAA